MAARPDFIHIGTGRAGSNWLTKALGCHPEIFVTPVKETNFFDLNYHRGVEWYESFFAGAEGRVAGEIAHRYMRNPEVPRRIRETLGTVKLLVVYRKPEDFVLSSYLYARRNGHFESTADEWMIRRFKPDSIQYHAMIQPFLAEFGRQSIHVGCFDDLVADPEAFLAGFFSFLGVSPIPFPEHLREKVNPASRPRHAKLAFAVNRASKFAKRRGGQRLIAWVKRQKLLTSMLYSKMDASALPALPEAVKAEIRRIAEPEVRLLDRDLGTGFSSRWYAAG